MTTSEFSNEFDVLYNSITSNQAPGLDEYEKSVFLTKAQDDIIKSYFNPKSNKSREGFDGNEKRQIDFSMIMKSVKYEKITVRASSGTLTTNATGNLRSIGSIQSVGTKESSGVWAIPTSVTIGNTKIPNVLNTASLNVKPGVSSSSTYTVDPFLESFFDGRLSSKSVTLEDDVLMFINEYVQVEDRRLTVVPINYMEYSRLMSKPYKRPLKNQAWRLLDNSSGYKKSEIVVGPNDEIKTYAARYVKRPRAIRLDDFDEVTLDGGKTKQECELDPILHPEILQRAVELAKAAYMGDLNSQIALGHTSQTNIGAAQASS